MTDTALASSLAYYARHGCALFPIPAGQKAPGSRAFWPIVDSATGDVRPGSFKRDFSTDPTQWATWQAAHPGCNFGVVAFASLWIIIDIDTSGGEAGRNEAWTLWCELCASWGIAPLNPHVQSARGGWHVYFQVPADLDASTLRQADAIKDRINVRCVGFTVAAGSFYDGTAKGEASGPYILLSDTPPYPAPIALVQHCTRVVTPRTASSAPVGSRDRGDVSALLQWLTAREAFAAYEDWLACGMALKLEYGDDGFDLWSMTFDDTVTEDVANTKWNSFATEPTASSVTINTLLSNAHKLGWTGQVRRSAASMFGGVVAQLANATGATLSSAPRGMPLLDTQKTVAALGQSILDNFLASIGDAPYRPTSVDSPQLPTDMVDHPLYEDMNTAVQRIMAMAEGGAKGFRQDRVLKVISVLHAQHQPTCENLIQRIAALGGVISPGKLDSAVKNFEWKVRVEQNTATGFITDSKGHPDSNNSDNVGVFARQRAIKLRYNVWKDQPEVSDASRDDYTQLNDALFGDLLMDAKNSQFNYHPSEGLFRRGLISLSRRSIYDPLNERLDVLASAWDGKPRLATWLSQCVGVPCDIYHQAVGRNLIGGLVRRARHPGCEQAETVIFISPEQGTGKSTLTKILALDPAWHNDSFKFGGSQQNSIPQLAGKWVVELGELAGMNKTEVEEIKQFLSSTTDNYTKKYEAFATDHLRRCVFIGTSNDKRPLIDATGNRRFLPVHVVGEVNLEWLRANVEQIMGEAAFREAQGEIFSIPRDVWKIAAKHQEDARQMTPVEELCQDWFARTEPYGFFITATDLGRALKMAGQTARYGVYMDKLGWRSENLIVPGTGRKCRVWVRHSTNVLAECARLVPAQTSQYAPVEMRMQSAGGAINTGAAR